MAGIPDDKVEQVRAASDIVDVVSDRVRLKKTGRSYIGLCPFHNEKTPSFNVVPDKGFFHCFGCKESGDVFSFVQKTDGMGFLDAVRVLAERAGIELEASGPGDTRKEALLAALRFAAGYFFDVLKSPEGERGRAYLASRGFSKEAVLEFGIGVSTPRWDGLATAASEKGYDLDVLEATGLVKRRQGGDGFYDVFRDRLMFPIFGTWKVEAFGGRILPDTQTGSDDYTPAKYVNSPETEVYHKSRVLYGMKQAKRAIRTEREAVVVEGYADVVSLWDAGVRNVVAVSGTALTGPQVGLLKKLDVERLILLFDADDAGQTAAGKAIDAALDGGLAPYTVALPDGADPDSFVRQFGVDAFRAVLRDERTDFVGFKARRARESGRLATPEGKALAVRDVLRTVRRVDDPIRTGAYLRRVAQEMDVYETDLYKSFEGVRAPAPRPTSWDDEPPPPAPPPAAEVRPEEEALVRLMLEQGPPMVEHVLTRMGLDEFTEGAPQTVVEALIAQFEGGAVDAAPFVRGEHGPAAQAFVTEVLAERHALSDNWHAKVGVDAPGRDKDPFRTAADAMQYLKRDRVEEAVARAMREMQARERGGQPIDDLQAHVAELHRLRRDIDSGAFMDWGT